MEPRYSFRPVRPADHAWLLWLHHAAMRQVVEQVWGWDEARQDEYFRRYIERLGFEVVGETSTHRQMRWFHGSPAA